MPSGSSKQDVLYWRDGALEGAALATARYGAHEFERHVHDELVIVMTEFGAGECRTRAGSEVSGAGTVLVFEPGEYHCGEVWENKAWHYRAIYLDMHGLAALSAVFSDDSRGDRPLFIPPGLYCDPQLCRLLLKAHASLDQNGQTPLMERQANWWAAMGMLFGRYGQPRPVVNALGRDTQKMARVRDYIAARFARDIPIDELAAVASLSRYHLIRAFRKEYGLPPHAYANQLRLIAAKQLLVAGRSAVDAAASAGFYDQSHLNRVFKRAYGITPGAYAALKPAF
ncbi:MAG: AraC family transcriptional regulator [Paraburkholderia sp.]|jgi:AraC-like DNA-binding protein|uniref:AraC family transcriptional regulator n=1 Tax=Burkholderiaceae TaxID=119060 RepID=UPI0010F5C49D|nr:AraC family transcriptional regulator [Burkholderia sp. 4M9327F10]